MNEPLAQLAAIVVLAVTAQWLAWRLHLPSILLLLLFGFLAGPVAGIIEPDALMGEALFPFVSLAVALILFEGGLTLRLSELPYGRAVIFRLISVGALVTWALATLAGRYLTGLDWSMAVLVGSVLIVTGPTVVGPLLRQIRPKGRSGSILKWEGILIDPVGAITAVLVFEVILLGEISNAPTFIIFGGLESLAVGVVSGLLAAGLLIVVLQRFWVPDYLQNPVALVLVLGTFTLANLLSHEAGLVTVTVMGLALANQNRVSIRHIVEFKENLQVLLIGVLFILLAGRLELDALLVLSWRAALFVAFLILIARPATVLVSTWRTPLTWKERLFAMWMAPRGIVAASVASVFAFELTEIGQADAEFLVPLVFVTIVGTVAFYGLTAGFVARRLGLAEQNPQGILVVGAHEFGRQLASTVQGLGFRAVLLDNNLSLIAESRMRGLDAAYGSALSEETLRELDLVGVGRLLAMTANDEVNSLATLLFPEVFSREEVYQLPFKKKVSTEGSGVAPHLRGRYLFDEEATYECLSQKVAAGWSVKATPLTQTFGFEDYRTHYGDEAIPLMSLTDRNRLVIYATDRDPAPRAGQTIIGLVPPGNGRDPR